jgi:hypothetical protein
MFKILSTYICWKKYIKCNIWRVAVCQSYIYDAQFLKVNCVDASPIFWVVLGPVWHSGWSHLPTNWSSFSDICIIHFVMKFHVNLSVRELKLHHWCYFYCWDHTPHLQTKAHFALFVRPKQKRSRSTWDKVIQSCVAFWLYAGRFPSVHICVNKPAGAPNTMIYCFLTDD